MLLVVKRLLGFCVVITGLEVVCGISFDDAVRYTGVELARQDIKDRLVAGDIRNQEELTNLIAGSLKDQGREYNVNNANEELAIIYNNY